MNEKLKKYLPGKRILKTALSVCICFLSADLANKYLGTNFVSFYASLAAIFTLQNTIDFSKLRGSHRFIGSTIGALVGMFFVFVSNLINISNSNLIIVFLGIVFSIQICNLLKINNGTMVACIVFLASFTVGEDNYYIYILVRLFETFYGIITALLVNQFIFRPKNK